METLFLINPASFKGVAESTVSVKEDGRKLVDYSGYLFLTSLG